jgi:hypothetical protein
MSAMASAPPSRPRRVPSIASRAKRGAIVCARATAAPRLSLPSLTAGRASLRGAAQDAAVADVARGFVVPRARGALVQRELARGALRIAGVRATQPSRILGGLGSSWPRVSRPALSRAAGGCTVRRHHRSHRHERHAPATLRAARPHAPRAAAGPRTTSK